LFKKNKKTIDSPLVICDIGATHGNNQTKQNMRTKILLTVAAALAAGLVSSNAQVYSANVVGYVNVVVTNGYTLVANQMDLDLTGTNNSIYTVVGTNLPSGTIVEDWTGAGFGTSKLLASGKWTVNNQNVTNSMNPGNGFFINSGVTTNIIEVGNVYQGTNSYPIAAGLQVVSFKVPVSGTMDTSFGYVPSKGDIIEVWTGAGFGTHKWLGASWSAGDPTLSISQAMFLNAASNNVWNQGFTVQ
jgi:hypothetical protein